MPARGCAGHRCARRRAADRVPTSAARSQRAPSPDLRATPPRRVADARRAPACRDPAGRCGPTRRERRAGPAARAPGRARRAEADRATAGRWSPRRRVRARVRPVRCGRSRACAPDRDAGFAATGDGSARRRRGRHARRALGRGLRDVDHGQAGEAGVRIEARLAGEAAVDDAADAGQGDAGFGDVGGQHHPAPSRRGRLQRRALFGKTEFSVQGDEIDIGCDGRRQHRAGALDLAAARQEHQHVPSLSASEDSTTRRTCCGQPRSGQASPGRAAGQSMSTAKLRPALLKRGASNQRAMRSPSRVADMMTRRRSGRRWACTSRASAAPRSPCRCRSWNSSNRIAPIPASSGSSCSMRVRMPSVTTSMRVAADTRDSRRMR